MHLAQHAIGEYSFVLYSVHRQTFATLCSLHALPKGQTTELVMTWIGLHLARTTLITRHFTLNPQLGETPTMFGKDTVRWTRIVALT